MTTTIDLGADVIALERAALDRWGAGDPTGYVELFDHDITYFDPVQDRRIDGRAPMVTLMESIAGRIRVDRYDMLRPVVQRHGDVALLSFNLVSYRSDDGRERVISRWNATEAYRRTTQGWRIVHSHWSYIQPATPSSEYPESVTG
jgi:ketosteroid isomerase-like protein